VPTDDASTIRRFAGECLKRVDLRRRIRLLGVRVGALCSRDARQALSEPDAGTAAPLFSASRD